MTMCAGAELVCELEKRLRTLEPFEQGLGLAAEEVIISCGAHERGARDALGDTVSDVIVE